MAVTVEYCLLLKNNVFWKQQKNTFFADLFLKFQLNNNQSIYKILFHSFKTITYSTIHLKGRMYDCVLFVQKDLVNCSNDRYDLPFLSLIGIVHPPFYSTKKTTTQIFFYELKLIQPPPAPLFGLSNYLLLCKNVFF